MSSPPADAGRPRVVLLRGHNANVWDLRPWERLGDEFAVSALVTGSNLHQVEGLGIELVEVRTPRDALPGGRAAGAAAYAIGERYLKLEDHLAGADVGHAAEIGPWFAAQAARAKRRLPFKLVLTVWETIAWREAYRWPRERRYRRAVLPAADLFLPTTERARQGLLLEGVDPGRMEVCPPGIELAHFARPAGGGRGAGHEILSAGRLVWEKGHQDVLRAFAALRGGLVGPPRDDVRLRIVGDGPERKRLERYAADLGVAEHVTFVPKVRYEEMPQVYANASCLVLASLPTRTWEEQFGMVLVEALAAGTPVVAASSGAIPEVVGDAAELFTPGVWLGLARVLDGGPLGPSAGTPPAADLGRFGTEAAAERYRAAYRRVLAASARS
jgi:glycosyltransferase involved in cell wall biosynthesis